MWQWQEIQKMLWRLIESNTRRVALVLLSIGLFAGSAFADIYKFEDYEGRILLTNIPSSGKDMKLLKRFRFSYAHPRSGGKAPPTKQLKARIRKLEPVIREIAQLNGLSPDLIHAVILAESAYRADAQSPKGAMGLMQLIPGTAKRFAVNDPWDPTQNIKGGARYLKWLMQRFDQDLDLVLAAYNAGEGAVEKYGRSIPPYQETQRYVEKVKDFMDKGMSVFLE